MSRFDLDLETGAKLEALDPSQLRRLEGLAGRYLSRMATARRAGHLVPEAVAREPKLDAYRLLGDFDFTPDQAVAVFRQICHDVAHARNLEEFVDEPS